MKILQIPYYSVRNAVTGGQRRVSNFRGLLDELGHQVTTIAISPRRSEYDENDILLDWAQNDWVFRIPSQFELRLARAVSLSDEIRGKIGAIFEQEKPDLLWLEHPFLWKVLEPFVTPTEIPVIYSSHNIEWKMKRELLANQKIFDPLEIYEIKQIEENLARRAAAIVCCSQADAIYYQKLSGKLVTVVPNGADVPSVSDIDSALGTARSFCSDAFIAPTFCYVSSEHLPNWQGLVDLVLNPMAARYPARSAIILLIGSIGRLYRSWAMERNFPSWWLKVVTIAEASEDVKNLSLMLSDAILLPIAAGGGTNLKTAEALLAGRQIIATSTAFRGFEKYMEESDVSIADGPEAFRDAMDRVINAPRQEPTQISANSMTPLKQSPHAHSNREALSWKSIRRNAAPRLAECLRALES